LSLRKNFGPFAVLNISGNCNEHERAKIISNFKENSESWILVGGQDAEEGLNLQFIDSIMHLDLPTNVERLEQRIGRLDRFGRRLPKLEQRIFLPNDDEDAPWYAWFDILMNGFQIFSGSVSDIQFKLEELELNIWGRMFDEGASCTEDLSEMIAKMITEERVKLNEQHVLDQIANLSYDAEPLVQRMEDAEENEDSLNSVVFGWTHKILNLNQSPPRPDPGEAHRVFWDRPLLPRIPWQRILNNSLDKPLTWHRNLAQAEGGDPILLRPGALLLNALERIANWDDRGTAYATWRVDTSVEETWVGFRWVWVLSPGMSSEAAVWQEVERPDLYRRTEYYLPILTIDQWTDFHGELVTDTHMIHRLNRPYNKKPNNDGVYDINLGSRPEALAEIVDPIVFSKTLNSIRQLAMDDVWENSEVALALKQANARFERDDALIRRTLDRRESYLREKFGQEYVGVEEALQDLDVIGNALDSPVLRLDECGLMIVSPEAPNAGGT